MPSQEVRFDSFFCILLLLNALIVTLTTFCAVSSGDNVLYHQPTTNLWGNHGQLHAGCDQCTFSMYKARDSFHNQELTITWNVVRNELPVAL